jgi:hypothetical protein
MSKMYVIELPLTTGAGSVSCDPGACELPNARFVTTFEKLTCCEKVRVNFTAGPAIVPGPWPVDVVVVTGPNVAVRPEPKFPVRVDGSADAVCTGCGATGVSLVGVGDGLALADFDGAAVVAAVVVAPGFAEGAEVAEVFAGVGFAVAFAPELVDAPALGARVPAGVEALDIASVGAELATPGDDITTLDAAADAATDAEPDDAALA